MKMNLYGISTTNGEEYEFSEHSDYVILATSEDEAKSTLKKSNQYGCEQDIDNVCLIAENVTWPGMPEKASVIY